MAANAVATCSIVDLDSMDIACIGYPDGNQGYLIQEACMLGLADILQVTFSLCQRKKH